MFDPITLIGQHTGLTKRALDVTGADFPLLVQLVYTHSRPVGMGFLHYQVEPLTTDELAGIVGAPDFLGWALHMDYIHGRQCKFAVHSVGPHWRSLPSGVVHWIEPEWFDHTAAQFEELQRDYLRISGGAWRVLGRRP